MVKVRVQHPPEASVKIHQVLKVGAVLPASCLYASSYWTVCPWLQVSGPSPGPGPALQALASSTSSGSAGAPAPRGLQTPWGGGNFKQQSEFKYCFREVKDGQVRGPTAASPESLFAPGGVKLGFRLMAEVNKQNKGLNLA